MRCYTCKTEKPFDHFPKNEKRCRPCLAEKYKRWALKNPDKRRAINLKYSRTDKGRANSRRVGAKYRSVTQRLRDKIKVNAAAKLSYHVRVGNVKRGPCSKCGDQNTIGHHHDYSKPLDVIWLCPRHHAEVHANDYLHKDKTQLDLS